MRAGLGARKQTSMKGRMSQVHVSFSMMFSSSVCGPGGYQLINAVPTTPQYLDIYVDISKAPQLKGVCGKKKTSQPGYEHTHTYTHIHRSLAVTLCTRAYANVYLSSHLA